MPRPHCIPPHDPPRCGCTSRTAVHASALLSAHEERAEAAALAGERVNLVAPAQSSADLSAQILAEQRDRAARMATSDLVRAVTATGYSCGLPRGVLDDELDRRLPPRKLAE